MKDQIVVGKCRSWRGHKFEARHDISEPILSGLVRINGYWDPNDFKRSTYVHDICTRCGKIVHREALK